MHVSFLGYDTGTPDSLDDFDTGLTKVCVHAYAASTTGCTLAVSTGDGTNFGGSYNMGIAWQAIG